MLSGSLRRGLLIIILTVTTGTLLPAFALYSSLQFHELREILAERSESYARLLASNVQDQLTQTEGDWTPATRAIIQRSDFIHNIHLYRYHPVTGVLEFYEAYNHPGVAAIPARGDQIEALQRPVIDGYALEIAVPVVINGDVAGYLFMRSHLYELENFVQHCVAIIFLILVAAVLLATVGSQLLSRYFTRPMHRIISTMQDVARTKNYNLRLEASAFIELDMLAHHFNTTLDRIQQHIRQREKVERYASQLNTDLEREVQERTEALRQANQELLETLEQLHQHQGRQVEVQRLSSLTDLVAGISHEINTPVGLAVTSSSLMQDKLYDLEKAFAQRDVSTEQFEAFLQEARESIDIIHRNLNRAAELVNNFKKLAIEHASEALTEVEFDKLLHNIVFSSRPRLLDEESFPVRIECPSNLSLAVKTGVWQQILFQLMENSALHGFGERDSGEVRVQVSCDEYNLKLVYTDDGSGVPKDILRRIFDPFVTTKRGLGSSGLGMHLVYNLVTHTLGGRIHCYSEPGEGLKVVIECPIEHA